MQYDQGILNGTTAFGKTVTAIGLIAERKVNTLILVHTRILLEQWKVPGVGISDRRSRFSLWYARFQRK